VRDDPARRVATELRRRGLAPAARLLIDAHRPLSPLLADVGAALGPLAGALGGPGLPAVVRLAEEDGLDRLMAELGDGPEGAAGEPVANARRPGERDADPG
jgi:hypothetical protein